MLNKVRFWNSRSDMLELPLEEGISQYVIKGIDGLGPVKADIATTTYVSMDGGAFQSARGNMRNLVFRLGFDPSFETDDPYGILRRDLYQWLAPKKVVDMSLYDSEVGVVTIQGIVETNEPNIWSADPEIVISILCPQPYFLGTAIKSGVFSGPVTTGSVQTFTLEIDNPGNADATGFTLLINGLASLDNGFLVDRSTVKSGGASPEQFMNYVGGLYVQGEPMTIQIVTVPGSKSAEWMMQVDYDPMNLDFPGTNMLGYIDGWLDLVPGLNRLRVMIPASSYGDRLMNIEFTPKYVGL